jgi:hypothetical protein
LSNLFLVDPQPALFVNRLVARNYRKVPVKLIRAKTRVKGSTKKGWARALAIVEGAKRQDWGRGPGGDPEARCLSRPNLNLVRTRGALAIVEGAKRQDWGRGPGGEGCQGPTLI